MKKYILNLIISAFAISGVSAQAADKIRIQNLSVETDHGKVNVMVAFTANVDRKAVPMGTTLIYAPVITDGHYKVSLPAIVVQSGRAKKNWSRHEWRANTRAIYDKGIYTQNGGAVNYSTTVPFQPWMHQARIDIETVIAGCCNSDTEKSTLIAGILPLPTHKPQTETEPEVIPISEVTLTEYLMETFPFVLPASEFDPDDPIKFYDDERDNALTVYYKINKYNIEEDYADNRQTLINLIAAIELIQSSGEARVERIVVAGFASPEGTFEFNDRLAWNRAESIEKFITDRTAMTREEITLFNGSADWLGLKLAIEADENVPGRTEALDIITNIPEWDSRTKTGRQTHLRNLRGGETYSYLREHIFPKQRNGAFIRVYVGESE